MIAMSLPGHGVHSWPSFWLRDSCQCRECVHPETRQRLLDTFSLPLNIKPSAVRELADHVEIEWANDGHKSIYTFDWLRNHQFRLPSSEAFSNVTEGRFRADQAVVPNNPELYPTVDYDEVTSSDAGVRKWTSQIFRWGFSFVRDCPVTPEATQKLLERIAFIRPTHYGGFWDFTSDLKMKDTAYTSYGLGAHTDTTYFTDPAGLQMFHMLSHTGGDGGASLLVDGFEAAQVLYSEDPESYEVLSTHLVNSHASGNEDVCIQPSCPFPILNHHPVTKELYQIRWNNDDRTARSDSTPNLINQWYIAARKWSEILKRKEMERWIQLEPGTPLIFNNWRVLHGRAAFTGKRRMCGGYINHDDFMSRYLLLKNGRNEVLSRI